MMNKFLNHLTIKFFFSLVLFFIAGSAFAQKSKGNLNLFVHALYGFSLESSSDKYYKGQYGGVAGLGYKINNTMPEGTIGYSSIAASEINPGGTLSYIPFKVGVRQFLPLQKTTLFGQGNVGVGFLSASTNLPETGKTSDTRFAFDLGVGAKIGESIETAIIWDNYKEKGNLGWSSWLTLRLGWAMNF